MSLAELDLDRSMQFLDSMIIFFIMEDFVFSEEKWIAVVLFHAREICLELKFEFHIFSLETPLSYLSKIKPAVSQLRIESICMVLAPFYFPKILIFILIILAQMNTILERS